MSQRLLLTLVACLGCAGDPTSLKPDLGSRQSSWVPDSAAILATEDITGSGYYGHYVARDSVSFAAIWHQAFGWMNQPQPRVDFTTSIVILEATADPETRIRLDSVLTYENGTRAFTSTCSAWSPQQVEHHPGQLVQIPRNEGMYFHRSFHPSCW